MDTTRFDAIARVVSGQVRRRRALWVTASAGLYLLGLVADGGREAQATTKAKRRRKRQKAYRKRRLAGIRRQITVKIAECQAEVPTGVRCYTEAFNCCYFWDNLNYGRAAANYCACINRTDCATCTL